MSEPKVIYLGPACQEQGQLRGREWCQDDVWDACECGHESVRYVLASDFDRVTAENAALQQRLNAADQRIDDLAAAAEPFAKVADLYAGEEDNSHVPARDFGMHDDLRLALGQFRALRDLCIRPLMVGCKNGILCGDVTCECKGNGFVERDHQIPGTSGMRLNMLANQGE